MWKVCATGYHNGNFSCYLELSKRYARRGNALRKAKSIETMTDKSIVPLYDNGYSYRCVVSEVEEKGE